MSTVTAIKNAGITEHFSSYCHKNASIAEHVSSYCHYKNAGITEHVNSYSHDKQSLYYKSRFYKTRQQLLP
jgi:hypothetical protein